ncbi:MAG: type II/IV secretion system protein [Anaplasmataceae bacterium]|nr:type II/IV secretion system protein [Anaplasmataceae bacterium]
MATLPIPVEQLKTKLVDEGIITPEMFDTLLQDSDHKGQDFLDLLLSENVVTESYLNNYVSETLGVERAGLSSENIDENLVRLLPEDIARKRQVIVFKKEENNALGVAMANPNDLETIQFLSQFLKSPIKSYLATQDDLNSGFSIYGRRLTQDFKKLIDKKIEESLHSRAQSAEEAAAQLPIVEVVDNLISYALAVRASDIHIEILDDVTLIRYRIDGILTEVMRLNKAAHSAIVARIKLLSGLKIDEHHKPQDGRFRSHIINKVVDIRVSVLPTVYGEKIAMRLLEGTEKPLSMEELGMSEDMRRLVIENISKAYGMVLVTGPTGAGKTTTLYSFLNILNKPEVNVTSIEDPVEYNIRYVNQIQINPQAGVTFASGLRSILRQDPNIIMVGEIRDGETANIAVQSALTGHLLLSSLHTNDAPTAIPRLIDLGIPPFLVSSVLNLILAQRLVRKICQTCVYSYQPGPELAQIISNQLGEKLAPDDKRIPRVLYKGKGCETCGSSGYRGRLGIYEALEITPEVKIEISKPTFSLASLRAVARRDGMITMFEDGLDKVQLAVTSIEEVLRVIKE